MKRLFLAIIFAAALVFTSCGNASQKDKDSERIENVQVITIEPNTITRNIEYSTILEGYEQINVSPSIQGNIEKIYVEPGAKVSEGQLLVTLDQMQLNSAKVQKSTLSVELARTEALLKAGNISQSVYDQLKSQYDMAEENLIFLQKNTFVRAPFSGVVAAKNYENGEMYSPAKPILQISQITRLKAYINIPESYYPVVKSNMSLDIISDIYPDKVFKGKIEIVYPVIDPNTHTFTVKLDIHNPSRILRPGMFVRTTLALGQVDAMVVPYNAVLKQQGSNERYVFVKRGDIARRVSVSLGQRFDDMTEIISDSIRKGDRLITVGQSRLIDGVRINVTGNQVSDTIR